MSDTWTPGAPRQAETGECPCRKHHPHPHDLRPVTRGGDGRCWECAFIHKGRGCDDE